MGDIFFLLGYLASLPSPQTTPYYCKRYHCRSKEQCWKHWLHMSFVHLHSVRIRYRKSLHKWIDTLGYTCRPWVCHSVVLETDHTFLLKNNNKKNSRKQETIREVVAIVLYKKCNNKDNMNSSWIAEHRHQRLWMKTKRKENETITNTTTLKKSQV